MVGYMTREWAKSSEGGKKCLGFCIILRIAPKDNGGDTRHYLLICVSSEDNVF